MEMYVKFSQISILSNFFWFSITISSHTLTLPVSQRQTVTDCGMSRIICNPNPSPNPNPKP